MTTTNNEDLNQKTNEKLLLFQKSIALVVKRKEQIITELESKLKEKENEILKLKDANKSMEKKNDEIFKESTFANLSDISEIKIQFDKEQRVLNEMIKTLKKDLDKKNETILKLNEELESTRNQLELERKLNQKYFSLKSPLVTQEKIDIKLHKVSSENTSLKANQLNLEDTISNLKEENKKLIEDKKTIEKNLEEIKESSSKNFLMLKESYDKLIKDFLKVSENLYNSKKSLSEYSNENINYKNDIKTLQLNIQNLEKENIDIKSENDGIKKRIQTYEYEFDSLKKEIKELEKTISENKYSKRVFYVEYTYMGVSMNGNITIEKDLKNNYNFIIENRTTTRKFSFLDIDIISDKSDPRKIIIKFHKLNTTEEYYTSEAKVLLENFKEFKKRVIEVSDITSDAKSQAETDKKVYSTEKKLNNFLNII